MFSDYIPHLFATGVLLIVLFLYLHDRCKETDDDNEWLDDNEPDYDQLERTFSLVKEETGSSEELPKGWEYVVDRYSGRCYRRTYSCAFPAQVLAIIEHSTDYEDDPEEDGFILHFLVIGIDEERLMYRKEEGPFYFELAGAMKEADRLAEQAKVRIEDLLLNWGTE